VTDQDEREKEEDDSSESVERSSEEQIRKTRHEGKSPLAKTSSGDANSMSE